MKSLSNATVYTHRIGLSNMDCVTIPLATLSSRSDDKFSHSKQFGSLHFNSNNTPACGKFDV